jgi:hypothetical protein
MNSITDLLKKPAALAALAFLAGVLIGLGYAWGIDPVRWTDQPISATRQDLQETYLRMAIDSFRVNGDAPLAVNRYLETGPQAYQIFQVIKNAPGKLDPQAVAMFEQVLQQNGVYTPGGVPTPEPAAGGAASSLVSIAIIFGGLLAIGLVAAAAFWLFRGRNKNAPLTPQQQALELSRSAEKTDYASVGREPPVAQYVTTYVIGDDLFDDSFSIDAPSGEFLGECGVGISETIGVGDPKKVTAFEVWMFDKNDIQTVTKVLMSAHAFADVALRAKLEAKGELTQIAPQSQVVLETQTLQMVVTVADAVYGQAALPEQSFFERITLELAIWPK